MYCNVLDFGKVLEYKYYSSTSTEYLVVSKYLSISTEYLVVS